MSLDTEGRLRKGSFSFYEITLQQLERLAEQRKQERDTDLQKTALHIGTLFLTMTKGRVDPSTGLIGNWSVDELAEDLRQWILLGNDWLERHGHPINSEPPSPLLSSLIETLLSQREGVPTRGEKPMVPPSHEQKEEPNEAFISGTTLSSLNLDDDPML